MVGLAWLDLSAASSSRSSPLCGPSTCGQHQHGQRRDRRGVRQGGPTALHGLGHPRRRDGTGHRGGEHPDPGDDAYRTASPYPEFQGPRPGRLLQVDAQTNHADRLGRWFEPGGAAPDQTPWVRHSIAEDQRDIDGLVATLADDCVYEIVGTGQRWDGHAARALLRGAVRRVPRQRVRAERDRHRAAGRLRGGDPDRDEPRAMGRRRSERASRSPSRSLILFPWDTATERLAGRRGLVRSGCAGPPRFCERARAPVATTR